MENLGSDLPVDPKEALSAAKSALVIPPGWIPSPIAPISVPYLITSIPFDPKVKAMFTNPSDPISQSSATYMTNLIGEEKFQDMLSDAAKLGEANSRLQKCLGCMTAAYCCFPCFYYCVYKPADNKPRPLFTKWQNEMQGKDVDFELWFQPGSILAALISGNAILAQKTFAFVVRPTADALLKAAMEKEEQALALVEEDIKSVAKESNMIFDFVGMGVGAAVGFLGFGAPVASTEEKKTEDESEPNKTTEPVDITPDDRLNEPKGKREKESGIQRQDSKASSVFVYNSVTKSVDKSTSSLPPQEQLETNNQDNISAKGDQKGKGAVQKTPERVCGCLEGKDVTA